MLIDRFSYKIVNFTINKRNTMILKYNWMNEVNPHYQHKNSLEKKILLVR